MYALLMDNSSLIIELLLFMNNIKRFSCSAVLDSSCYVLSCFRRTLVLAQELGDRAVEAQACYSLGNTYTLLRDYETAIEYHLRHLMIAQHLGDRVGEGRACWSLGNAHAALGNHEKALYFASKHLEISKEVCQ